MGLKARRRVTKRSPRKKPQTLRLRDVMPAFTVNDIDRSLAWYRGVAGFVIEDEWRHDGRLVGGVVKAGVVRFMLMQDDWAKGRDRPKGIGFRVYCTSTRRVDDIAADIAARGGRVAEGPVDRPWGGREIVLVDPDGFKVTIANPSG